MPHERRNDEYRRAVAAVAANCGRGARALLSGHPLLTPDVVRSLARTTPERQAFELSEVRAGRRPFATKTEAFDTTGYGEVGSRLARAGGYINKFACAVARSVTGDLSREDRDAPDRSATGLLRHCGALWTEVRLAYAARPADRPDGTVGFNWQPPRDWSELAIPSVRSIVGMLGAPTGFLEKCVRDLRRVPDLPLGRRFWPTRGQAHSLGVKLFQMSRQLLKAREQLARANVGTTPCVVTHAKPDADALVAAWLAERYLFSGRRVEVAFVACGHNWASEPAADCVVDVGGLHDPTLGLFDHRPPARADRYETCATELVWKHLSEFGRNVEALVPLVDAVRAGDSPSERGNSAEYAVSRQKGVHAVVARLRGRGASDRETWTAVRRWLNQYRIGPSPT